MRCIGIFRDQVWGWSRVMAGTQVQLFIASIDNQRISVLYISMQSDLFRTCALHKLLWAIMFMFNSMHTFATFHMGRNWVCTFSGVHLALHFFWSCSRWWAAEKFVASQCSLASLTEPWFMFICCLQPSLWCSICVRCLCSVARDFYFAHYILGPVFACLAQYSLLAPNLEVTKYHHL